MVVAISIFCWLLVGTCRNQICVFLIFSNFRCVLGCFNHSLRAHFVWSSSVFNAPLCFFPLPMHLPSWVWKLVEGFGGCWLLSWSAGSTSILSRSSLLLAPSRRTLSICLHPWLLLTPFGSFLVTPPFSLLCSFSLLLPFITLSLFHVLTKLRVLRLRKAAFFAGVAWFHHE